MHIFKNVVDDQIALGKDSQARRQRVSLLLMGWLLEILLSTHSCRFHVDYRYHIVHIFHYHLP